MGCENELSLRQATMVFNPALPGEVLKDYLDGMTVKEAFRVGGLCCIVY